MATKIIQLTLTAASPEKPTTRCPGGGDHQWVLKKASGSKSLDDKIQDLKSASKAGTQFEGIAAEHNKKAGTLSDSRDLSEDTDPMVWKCTVAGCHFATQSREADHTADSPPGKQSIVEVKATRSLDERSARQLGRNLQAASQGQVAGVIMKVPAGPQRSTLVGQIRAVAASLGKTVSIIRV